MRSRKILIVGAGAVPAAVGALALWFSQSQLPPRRDTGASTAAQPTQGGAVATQSPGSGSANPESVPATDVFKSKQWLAEYTTADDLYAFAKDAAGPADRKSRRLNS